MSRLSLTFICLWTVTTVAALWWIYQLGPGEPIIIDQRAGDQETIGWPIINRALHPGYAWILFAPYVWMSCKWFPLGLRRASLAIPVILLTAAAFIAASWKVSQQFRESLSPLVYIDSSNIDIPQVGMSSILGNLSQLFKGSEPSIIHQENSQRIKVQSATVMTNLEDLPEPLRKIVQNQVEAMSSGSLKVSPIQNLETTVTRQKNTTQETKQTSKAQMKQPTATPLLAGLHLTGFLLIAGLSHATIYFASFKERESRSARLAAEMSEAKLAHLQSQLSPHFLFNSLNGISSHVHEEPDDAVEMISHLSDLLRIALSQPESGLISLRRELEILDHYLELQTMRFGDRLTVVRLIEPASLDAQVPPLLLQPLVENAIHHAIEPQATGGTITIRCGVHDGQIDLSISDNGIGEGGTPGTGTGLKNITARLESYFPEAHQFSFHPSVEGSEVKMSLPFTSPES